MNHCYVSGNLTKDGELRTTQGGTEILTFGIAVNDRKRDTNSGEWIEVPNFFDCVVFGKRANSLSRLLHKGMKCCIEGKLRWSQWNDKSGQKRSKVEIVVDEIEFMSQRKAESDGFQDQSDSYSGGGQSAPNSTFDGFSGYEYADSDIPF